MSSTMIGFEGQETCTVVLEACGAAYHWARVLTGLGHEVKLIAPEAVRPFVKRGKKNAAAVALCKAARRPGVAGAEHDRRGQPFLALDRDKPHGRTSCRFADRLGIRRIILLPLHEGLHVGRSDQPHRMPEVADLTPPVVTAGARLHRNGARRKRRKEWQQLLTAKFLPKQDRSLLIRPMKLERMLSEIQTNCGNLQHGRLPQVVFNTSTLAHRCRRGASTPSDPRDAVCALCAGVKSPL
jgi:hypothetical protein